MTNNLYAFLKNSRSASQQQTLWIDAICINQQNNNERNRQVMRMPDIYRSASQVMIWLGPATEKSNHAISMLSFLASLVNINWRTERFELADTKSPMYHLLDFDTALPFETRTWDSFNELLNRL